MGTAAMVVGVSVCTEAESDEERKCFMKEQVNLRHTYKFLFKWEQEFDYAFWDLQTA